MPLMPPLLQGPIRSASWELGTLGVVPSHLHHAHTCFLYASHTLLCVALLILYIYFTSAGKTSMHFTASPPLKLRLSLMCA